MYKLRELIAKHKVAIIILIIIILVIWMVFRSKGAVVAPTPRLGKIISYQGLTPGITSKERVIEELGTALNAKIENNKETYEYQSSNPNFNTEVVIFNDKLSYIKLVYTNKDDIKADDFRLQYGQPEEVFYGPDYSVGYILEAYPQRGFAFLSHKISRNVREAWYFEQMSLDSFRNTFAIGYSDGPKVVQ